jgi:hypothetical protein
MTDITNTAQEAAYSDALSLVAQGISRDETFTQLLGDYGSLEPDEIRDEMYDAYRDALKQGVEREDIDESWYCYG